MRKTILIITFFTIAFAGCKKAQTASDDTQLSSDAQNGVLRVLVNTDAQFNVQITELDPGKTVPDTLSVNDTETSIFSYGFIPKAGSQVTVKVFSQLSSFLQCTFQYKGVKIGPSVINPVNNGLEADLNYTVAN